MQTSDEIRLRRLGVPVDPDTKLWIEERMLWLARTFGVQVFRDAHVLLPVVEDFPESYEGMPADVEPMLQQLCNRMGIDRTRIQLDFYTGERPGYVQTDEHSPAGMYIEGEAGIEIWIDRDLLVDPLSIVATLAHELGHVLLLADGKISAEAPDHEPLTDLLTVFFGLGVITSNAVIRESHFSSGMESSWKIARYGYLTGPMYAYALALFALCREEKVPHWVGYLRPDIRKDFRTALRYLQGSGDSRFSPEALAQPGNPEEPSAQPRLPRKLRDLQAVPVPQGSLPEPVVGRVLTTEDGLKWTHAVCEICSAELAFPLVNGGSVQECPVCQAMLDVPVMDVSDEEADGDFSTREQIFEATGGARSRTLRATCFWGTAIVSFGLLYLVAAETFNRNEKMVCFLGLLFGFVFTRWWAHNKTFEWESESIWRTRLIVMRQPDQPPAPSRLSPSARSGA